MRHAAIVGLLVVWTGASSPGVLGQDQPGSGGFTPLFNGKDLTGFKTFLDPKAGEADPAKTWTVEEGVIRCSGKPSGYLYTDGSYSNYALRYDWRYPAGSAPSSIPVVSVIGVITGSSTSTAPEKVAAAANRSGWRAA